MPVRYPKVWDWADEEPPRRLSEWTRAPDKVGFYEIGFLKQDFVPMYGGRAAGTTLRERLHQHWSGSHNENIVKNRLKLWYRCKAFKTVELASFVEAVSIAAMDYPWNKRNEWTQHSALEDL